MVLLRNQISWQKDELVDRYLQMLFKNIHDGMETLVLDLL